MTDKIDYMSFLKEARAHNISVDYRMKNIPSTADIDSSIQDNRVYLEVGDLSIKTMPEKVDTEIARITFHVGGRGLDSPYMHLDLEDKTIILQEELTEKSKKKIETLAKKYGLSLEDLEK